MRPHYVPASNASTFPADMPLVQDVVDNAKTISPITCDRTCAQQFGVVSAASPG